jgi:hypothetical protein
MSAPFSSTHPMRPQSATSSPKRRGRKAPRSQIRDHETSVQVTAVITPVHPDGPQPVLATAPCSPVAGFLGRSEPSSDMTGGAHDPTRVYDEGRPEDVRQPRNSGLTHAYRFQCAQRAQERSFGSQSQPMFQQKRPEIISISGPFCEFWQPLANRLLLPLGLIDQEHSLPARSPGSAELPAEVRNYVSVVSQLTPDSKRLSSTTSSQPPDDAWDYVLAGRQGFEPV